MVKHFTNRSNFVALILTGSGKIYPVKPLEFIYASRGIIKIKYPHTRWRSVTNPKFETR